ncbi:MAG: neocarzinostatin apoprotein domain-containing protein [Acidimicrobiales bacterium]
MKRLFASVMGLALAAGSLGLLGAPTASASSTPTMTITPNTGLTSNQAVTIAGSGFAPGASLAAVECIGSATTTTGCDLNAIAPISVSSSGTFSASFYVQTGPIGNGTCGTSATDANCLIAVGTLAGTLVASGPITFATASSTPAGPSITVTPATGLKNGDTVTITGSGFTAGDSLFALECLVTATSAAGCDTTGATPITANSDGTLPSTTFTVTAGAIGTGTCGTSASDLTGCVISVSNASAGDAAHAAITFAALASPTINVAPSTGLKNGETVTITGSGFTAGDSLYAVQCLATATSATGCNVAGATPITANSDGTLPSTTFTVTAGAIGPGACGTKAANARACVITVATAAGTDSGAAPIQFAVAKARVVRTLNARPTLKLHNGQVVTVFGHGFIPRDHVYIVECLAGASGAAGCDLRTLKAVTIRANGVLPATKFRVVTGKIGSRFCGTTRANLRSCTISVANVHKGDSKVLRIGFRLP